MFSALRYILNILLQESRVEGAKGLILRSEASGKFYHTYSMTIESGLSQVRTGQIVDIDPGVCL